MQTDRGRVVITGLGAITCLGETPEVFWQNLVAGKSGIGPMTLCDPTGYPCRIAGAGSLFVAAELREAMLGIEPELYPDLLPPDLRPP